MRPDWLKLMARARRSAGFPYLLRDRRGSARFEPSRGRCLYQDPGSMSRDDFRTRLKCPENLHNAYTTLTCRIEKGLGAAKPLNSWEAVQEANLRPTD